MINGKDIALSYKQKRWQRAVVRHQDLLAMKKDHEQRLDNSCDVIFSGFVLRRLEQINLELSALQTEYPSLSK